MLVIRYFRIGKKNQPYFKIVVTDKRRPTKGGRFVEEVGNSSPLTKKKVLKTERIKYWLSVGAKPSPTVYNLLISEKIIEGKKIPVHKKAKEKKEGTAEVPKTEAPKVEITPTTETPKAEEPKKEKPKTEVPKEEKPAEAASKETPK